MDLVEVFFAEDGSLRTCTPLFDPRAPCAGVEPAQLAAVCRELVSAYNLTRSYPDRRRPLDLRVLLRQRLESTPGTSTATRREMVRIADRLLGAIWVAFDTIDTDRSIPGGGPDTAGFDDLLLTRVMPPPLAEHLGPGPGGLVITARLYPGARVMDL